MHPEIEQRWKKLATAKEAYLSHLQAIPDSQFHQQPPAGWSASQVTEHLLFSETGTLGYMKKKSSSGWDVLETTGQEQKNNSAALNDRLASSERYKAPAVLPEPPNTTSKTDLLLHWEKTREEFAAFLEHVSEQHFDKLVFKQPIAGMLNILQTLEFIGHHIEHHIPQVERLSTETKK
jgi:hypothetical protein